MTLNEYQRATAKTVIYPHENAIDYCILGLCSEAGELAGKRKKQIRDGEITDDELAAELAAELGDLLWYVVRLAAELDWTLESIAVSNLYKLADRQRRGVIGGSGDER